MYRNINNFPRFVEMEHRILKFWESERIFDKLRDGISGNDPWSFIDGPITANNPMGVHHAWGRTLKDIYQRYHAMRGFDVRFQNGFDCQGLWIEVEVEKEHGFKSKRDILEYGIDNFVRDCKERVLTFSAKQTEQSIRLGYWMDWDDPDELRSLRDAMHTGEAQTQYRSASGKVVNDTPEKIAGMLGSPDLGGSYFTFSDDNNYTIWSFLKACHQDGDLDRATDVMPWCSRCGTGLSQMEVVEGRKITSHTAVFARFPIRDRDHEAFLIWTTTPWTLPANVAVAVNPKSTYLKIRQGDWNYYVGKENYEHERNATLEVEGKRQKRNHQSLRNIFKGLEGETEILAEVSGEDLVGLQYTGPFDHCDAQQRTGGVSPFPMNFGLGASASEAHISLPWSEVTGAEGTGIVHIAPGCGSEDYSLGEEHDLPTIAPLNSDGFFLESFGELSGHQVGEVSREVVLDLKARGLLVAKEDYLHVYPHCWRCKTELVFRLVEGWKIKMDWRDQIMQQVPTAKWIPADGEKRELDWLFNMGDWLISKNRLWGLALPIWECDQPGCDWFTVIGSRDELQEKAVAGWSKFDGHSPHRPHVDAVQIKCERCSGTANRVPEVGNPWLDAGIVALSTLRYNTDKDYWSRWFPGDLILESFPGQFRNWFYALLAMSVKMTGVAPFRSLLGHALVHDERGEEMHKSKGNSIAFDEAAEIIGAEPMRYIFAAQPTSTNLKFPDVREKSDGKTLFEDVAIRKIMPFWNCYKFFITYAQIEDWTPSDAPPAVEDRDILDRWILSRLESLVADANRHFGGFYVHRFMEQFQRFNEDLSNWYLRRSRSRFWGSEANLTKSCAFHTLYEVIKTQAVLFAPVLPFLAEEVYQSMVRIAEPDAPESVHLMRYPQTRDDLIDGGLEERMALAMQVKNLGLSLRNQQNIRVRQPLQRILVQASSDIARLTLQDPVYQQMILDEINVREVAPFELGQDVIRPLIKINFRTLGPRLDGKVQHVKSAVEASDPVELHGNFLRDGYISVELDGELIRLGDEDLIISYVPVDNFVAASQAGVVVALDTELTDELIAAGYARDLNRLIQSLRKDMQLEVDQRIRVRYAASDLIAELITSHQDYLRGETLAVEIRREDDLSSGQPVDIGGNMISVQIEPVGETG